MKEGDFLSINTEEIISQLAQDETGKRQHYRPVYSLHKWWARRPGALFRSIIILASQGNKELFVKNEANDISPKSPYFDNYALKNLIILDPFMGGGTTLVEANRMGAKVIGCDLNPVAHWVVKETLKSIDLLKLKNHFNELERTAGEKIKSLYKTKCNRCSQDADSLYVFWIRSLKCPCCNEETYLFQRTLLNKGLSRTKPTSLKNPATSFCPQCFTLNDWYGEGTSDCSACNHTYDPTKGTYTRGSFNCLKCNTEGQSLIKSLDGGKKLGEQLVAIEYICSCNKGRSYKNPDKEDLDRLIIGNKFVKENFDKLNIPKQRIGKGTSAARWLKHNFEFYHEVFNARQKLAFHYLIEGIKKIPDEISRNALLTAFSNSLEYNNMMTPYNYPHRKLHHLFNYHALPLTTMPVENSVWGIGKNGAGTFSNCYRRYLKSKEYCQTPFDKYKTSKGKIIASYSKNEKIEASFVKSFKNLKETNKGALLFCGDSSSLPKVPAKSVDFIITDPPYYDSIHYSELSNFFYVWLKEVANGDNFTSKLVPSASEAIVNQGMNKGEKEYQFLLESVFIEGNRVLKDKGKLVFTFHHTKWKAWWTIRNAIKNAGFRVNTSFPAMTEYKVNPHIRNKESLDMDLILICVKSDNSFYDTTFLTDPIEILLEIVAKSKLENISANKNRLFLYFMGALLRATTTAEEGILDFEWFHGALSHFDEYIDNFFKETTAAATPQKRKSYQLNIFD